MLPTKNPGYTRAMLGASAVIARYRLAPTVKIKLVSSNPNAVGSDL